MSFPKHLDSEYEELQREARRWLRRSVKLEYAGQITKNRIKQLEHGYDTLRTALHRIETQRDRYREALEEVLAANDYFEIDEIVRTALNQRDRP